MRIVLLAGVITAAVSLSSTSLTAQGIGVAPHVGTLGIGVDVGASLTRGLGIRAGANLLPLEIDLTEDDIDYSVTFPSPQFTAILDLVTPVGLRASAGALITGEDYEAVGQFTGTVTIGNTTYTSAEVGTLAGALVYRDVSPYLGIGFGSPGRSRLGFFLDVGVAFRGAPELTLAADGPIASNPAFQAELAAERASAQADLDSEEILKYYPVVTIGLTFRLGR